MVTGAAFGLPRFFSRKVIPMTEENPDVEGVDPGRVRSVIRELNGRKAEADEISKEVTEDQKEFCESTGVNKKALGWLRSLDKMKPDNRSDVVRSLERGLDIMSPIWGQEPDMLDKAFGDPGADPVEHVAKEAAE